MAKESKKARILGKFNGLRKHYDTVLDLLWSNRWEQKVFRIFVYILIAGICWYAPYAETWVWYSYPIWYSMALCFSIFAIGTMMKWMSSTEEG